MTCESLDKRQDSDDLRTCVASAAFEGEPVALPLADGSSLTAYGPPLLSTYTTFEDGVEINGTADGVDWLNDIAPRTDSVGETAGVLVAPTGGRYAVALADGRLLLRSRDGSAPVEVPIEVEMTTIGSWTGPHTIRMASSRDGQRFAAVDGGRTAFVVDGRTGERLWSARLDTTARAVGLSADGTRVGIALDDKSVQVWDVESGAALGRWNHPRPVVDLTFEGGSLLAWFSERTSTTRHQLNEGTTVSANQSYETTSTTPPAVVVWRLPPSR